MPAATRIVLSLTILAAVADARGGDWIHYADQTNVRIVADPSVGVADVEEKDYAWGDVDLDGWIDLVVVRKEPWTGSDGKRNVLFMNISGVLTDQTAAWIPGFLDATQDRDVQLVDVDNDGWDDVVTAAACHRCNPAGISDDSRLYMNLGEDGGDNWLGYGPAIVLIGTDGNNFTAVAAGDVNNDTYADLYFVSYNDNFEDQLLINGGAGNPGVFSVENHRLTSAMRSSSFGINAFIHDFDLDGWAEIAKAENGPVEIFRNDGSGFFDLIDHTYNNSTYDLGLGDLDGSGPMDLVITDDGTDRYVLNPVIDGQPDPVFQFPSSTGGFGGNSVVSDLDDDGWNDVIITDVDVDAPGCDRISDILRNMGDPPTVTFEADAGNLPVASLFGLHDAAVFDVDNDGRKDLVLGGCNGTEVWTNTISPTNCFNFIDQEIVCSDDLATFTVNIAGTNPCTGGASQVTFTGSADAVGEEACFTALVNAGGGFCCSTEICVTIPDCVALQNRLENPGFETGDLDGWTIGGTSAQTLVNTDGTVIPGVDPNLDPTYQNVRSGAYGANSLVLTIPSPGERVHFFQIVPVVPSSTYEVGYYVGVDTPAATGFQFPAQNVLYNLILVNGSPLMLSGVGTLNLESGVGPGPDDFRHVFGSYTTGPTQTTANVSFRITGSGGWRAGFSVDDFHFNLAPPASDLDGDDVTGIADLLALLAAWGSCSDCGMPLACPADFDDDCDVGIDDLLFLLGNWT